jgi:hypothetical protein
MNARERLSKQTFGSLEAMMTAYSKQAVSIAAEEHGQSLDFSGGSVAGLEKILAALVPPEPEEQEYLTQLWGSYLGEVLLREFGGEWTMSVYPGGEFSVPTVMVQGSRLYPLMKVYRRLTVGEGENIAEFYRLVRQRLEPTRLQ